MSVDTGFQAYFFHQQRGLRLLGLGAATSQDIACHCNESLVETMQSTLLVTRCLNIVEHPAVKLFVALRESNRRITASSLYMCILRSFSSHFRSSVFALHVSYLAGANMEQVSGNYSFSDLIGATATQVYRLGCYVHDHNCTTVTASKTPGSLVRPGHSFGKSNCLVLNGGFECVLIPLSCMPAGSITEFT